MSKLRFVAVLLALVAASGPLPLQAQASIDSLLDSAIAGAHRSAANKARDVHRRPRETLLFLGIKPGMTVVEMWPDSGWFAEVLAPALRDGGRYVAAQYPQEHATTNAGRRAARQAFDAKLKASPGVYDKVVVSDLAAPDRLAMVPPGTADMVLSFRSVHVWALPNKTSNTDATDELVKQVMHEDTLVGAYVADEQGELGRRWPRGR